MKKFLILIYIPVFFISCKKSNTAANITPDVVGKWTLYSWQGNPGIGSINANVTQYPCLSNNVLQINANNTTIGGYIGTDTCYIALPTVPKTLWSFIGIPGKAAVASTWSRSGNDIYIGGWHYVLSSSSGKLYLKLDTVTQARGDTLSIVEHSVHIKE